MLRRGTASCHEKKADCCIWGFQLSTQIPGWLDWKAQRKILNVYVNERLNYIEYIIQLVAG